MSIRNRIFAAVYERQLVQIEKAGLAARRARLLASAAGRVLEIGGGTGANLPYYGAAVAELTITEPEPPMMRRLQRRTRDHTPRPTVLSAPAQDLPFDDGSFDVVVSTLVLCTVPDQPGALREARRVLRPGGRLLFIEHVLSDDPRVAAWQHRLNGLSRFAAGGCSWNRPTLDGIAAAGFTLAEVERAQLHKAAPLARPLVIGSAVTGGPPPLVPGGTAAARA